MCHGQRRTKCETRRQILRRGDRYPTGRASKQHFKVHEPGEAALRCKKGKLQEILYRRRDSQVLESRILEYGWMDCNIPRHLGPLDLGNHPAQVQEMG